MIPYLCMELFTAFNEKILLLSTYPVFRFSFSRMAETTQVKNGPFYGG